MPVKHLLNLAGDRLHTLPILVLYITDGCNSRCVTCDIWRNPRLNMSRKTVEQITASIDDLNIRWVLLSGGEAMQHPHWPEIARRFRERGVYTMLLTNGLLLKKQIDDVLATVDEVIVSLDGGTAETYEAIRGVDAFDLVVEGMRLVREGGLPVLTRTTVQRANYHEIPQIIEVCRSVDINHVSFLTVDVSNPHAFGPRFEQDVRIPMVASMGPGAPPEHGPPADALTPDDVARLRTILDDVEVRFADEFANGRMAESIEKLRGMLTYFGAINGTCDFDPPRCNAPRISTVIEVDGTLRPCYFLPTWGKLNDRTLREAINDADAQALRRAQRLGQRHECVSCVCPLYKGPRSLLKL
ncbi:MAG: radical SAM protein [Chloroflexi bacterium]|nr:MAG: radical SAM protein [Chloroflexota bacterium]